VLADRRIVEDCSPKIQRGELEVDPGEQEVYKYIFFARMQVIISEFDLDRLGGKLL
jgi:hypothetical protein